MCQLRKGGVFAPGGHVTLGNATFFAQFRRHFSSPHVETDRPLRENRHDTAGRNLGVLRACWTGGEHIGGVDGLPVGQRLWNRDQIVIRIVHQEILGEIAFTLQLELDAAEHPAALSGMAALTVFASSARRDCTDRDPVAFFAAHFIRTRFVHDAHAFVTNQSLFGKRENYAHDVDVGGAYQSSGGF